MEDSIIETVNTIGVREHYDKAVRLALEWFTAPQPIDGKGSDLELLGAYCDQLTVGPSQDEVGALEALADQFIGNLSHDDLQALVDSSSVARDTQLLLQVVRETWAGQFNAEPYTSLVMMDYLLHDAGRSYRELWANPNVLNGKFTEATVPLVVTWPTESTVPMKAMILGKQRSPYSSHYTQPIFRAPGRCTTFALKMEESIKSLEGLDFEFHHTHHHRLARCKGTGLVIDTNSLDGPFILPEGVVKKRLKGDRTQAFSYASGSSKYETTDGRDRPIEASPTFPSSPEQAMAKCLLELAEHKRLQPLCYFRSYEPVPGETPLRLSGHAERPSDFELVDYTTRKYVTRYHGMVKWVLHRRELLLIPGGKDGMQQVIAWDGSGKADEECECRKVVEVFVCEHGGPYANRQWFNEEVKAVYDLLWDAATRLFGPPSLKGGMGRVEPAGGS
ncbi:hypothetical protein LTR33_007343 [Friedmanniomyces endolithicus]|nr:hypothetical protein LTR33_007343 [Friedmanniomyces endolithicus]